MLGSVAPDTILWNANVRTLDAVHPKVASLAIKNGRILAAGSDEIIGLADSGTETIDLGGRTVLPGFTDAHIHWQGTALSMQRVDIAHLSTFRETLDRIEAAAASVGEGDWIQGYGWAQGDWTDRAGEFPTAADLDAVTGNRPAIFGARSGHAAWLNTAAMQVAGIDASTQDPDGGSVLRDGDGNPTGVLFESAMQLGYHVAPSPTPEAVADAMEEAQQEAWRLGLTGIHDYDWDTAFSAMQILEKRGTLGLRTVKQINDPQIAAAQQIGLRSGLGSDWLRVGGLKIFADGALGAVTALMIEPYDSDASNVGVCVTPKDTMMELVLEATRRGFFATIHAIGDKAVRDVLDVMEAARAEEAKLGIPRIDRRHRIEHVQLLHPDDKRRLAELDIIGSYQPIHMTSDIEMVATHWGSRGQFAYTMGEQLGLGTRLVFGSDAPVESMNPFVGIHAAVTRQRPDGSPVEGWYPEQKIDLYAAISAYTTGPAWAAYREKDLGKLLPGFRADLIVLENDPYELDPGALHAMLPDATMVDGVWRFSEGL